MARTWLITGASRGLGRHLTEAVLDAGDLVVATARRPEQLDGLAARHGERMRTVALDVTDPAAAARAVKAATDAFGRLDVVVNNAGYANSAPIEEMAEDDFRAQIETNLFGVVNVTRAALPVLRAQRSGVFVQVSSIGGRVGGTPGMGAYQTAKFAVEGFSEVLAAEVAPFGVKVVIVEPGAFRTDWQGSSMELHPVGPDYEETVGAINTYRQAHDGTQQGDPARAAKAVIDAVAADDPPRRLILGSDALALARKSAEARAVEAERWAAVTSSTDFPSDER
ncbi:oxidoreductase [Actinomadura mexicana]|uniref:NADP-dependent 3-hydroxy acid dehydrogenase YdfG n=1 Tax=Actinomadura mexicana TaxID=134959 RepID=A0A238VPH2_9ACTN|nr:oxidoreductase [Actinomadura mexicana]SNR36116.1 NADP-dependent 3-hydroxy acid dehydrogenase YdfG [Actinomadura mexicana]